MVVKEEHRRVNENGSSQGTIWDLNGLIHWSSMNKLMAMNLKLDLSYFLDCLYNNLKDLDAEKFLGHWGMNEWSNGTLGPRIKIKRVVDMKDFKMIEINVK